MWLEHPPAPGWSPVRISMPCQSCWLQSGASGSILFFAQLKACLLFLTHRVRFSMHGTCAFCNHAWLSMFRIRCDTDIWDVVCARRRCAAASGYRPWRATVARTCVFCLRCNPSVWTCQVRGCLVSSAVSACVACGVCVPATPADRVRRLPGGTVAASAELE